MRYFIGILIGWALVTSASAAPLVFQGTEGLGKGKHIVFLAGDHEYRSEESLPALARILAKHHGFKCTVLFDIDPATGEITAGDPSNIPGLEALATADLAVVFLRFQHLPLPRVPVLLQLLPSLAPRVLPQLPAQRPHGCPARGSGQRPHWRSFLQAASRRHGVRGPQESILLRRAVTVAVSVPSAVIL